MENLDEQECQRSLLVDALHTGYEEVASLTIYVLQDILNAHRSMSAGRSSATVRNLGESFVFYVYDCTIRRMNPNDVLLVEVERCHRFTT